MSPYPSIGAQLAGADLRGADLGDASLALADLRGASLRGTDLRGADLRGANLTSTDLSGARLSGARLHGIVIGPGERDWGAQAPLRLSDSLAWESAVEAIARLAHSPGPLPLLLDTLDDINARLPGWAAPWGVVASQLATAGRAADAEQLLKMGLALTSSRVLRHDLARLYLSLGQPQEAGPWLEKLHADDPENPNINADLGYVLGQGGDLARARDLLERAVEGGADGAETWSALGMVAMSQRDYRRAIQACKSAVYRDPTAADHAVNLARVYEAQGDLIEALRALPDRGSDAILWYAAELAAQVGDLQRATQASSRLITCGNPSLRVAAAELLRELSLRFGPGGSAAMASSEPGSDLRNTIEALAGGRPLPERARPSFLVGSAVIAPAVEVPLHPDLLPAPHQSLGWHPTEPVPDLRPATASEARDALLELASAPPRPAPDGARPLFGGDLRSELARLAEVQPTPGLRARIEGWGELARWRIGPVEPLLQGQSLNLDGVHPGACYVAHGQVRWSLPPCALTQGNTLWHRAQALAWLGVDAQVFSESGRLVPAEHAADLLHLLGEEPENRRAMIAAVYLVWLRYTSGMAQIWPSQQATYASRAIAVVESTFEGRLLAWLA